MKAVLWKHEAVLSIVLATGIWYLLCATLGSRYPYNYDSISYALAIVDRFDIGKCQPHAWGYLYHILVCRLWLPFVENPFRIQQFQNIVYLFTALLFMLPADRRAAPAVLIPATAPLSLFFASTSVIHAASFTASAVLAGLILKLEEKKVHPLVVSSAFALCIGFRQDLGVFLGPVVLYALLRQKLSVGMWGAVLVGGTLLTAVWYVATAWSSGWLSPYREAVAIVSPFLRKTAIVYGASPRRTLWMILRMFVYIPAVFGPGGLLLAAYAARRNERFDLRYLAAATVPFFLYGTLFYMGLASYFASISGFVFVWVLRRCRRTIRLPYVAAMVLVNVLYFAVIPAPVTTRQAVRGTCPVLQSAGRLASWSGATGRASVLKNRRLEIFFDENVAGYGTFSSGGKVECNGIPFWRVWNIMGERVWHNRYVTPPESAQCRIRYVRPGEHPDRQYDSIGIWYRDDNAK